MSAIARYSYTSNNTWILGVLESAGILGYPVFKLAKWFNGKFKKGKKLNSIPETKLYYV